MSCWVIYVQCGTYFNDVSSLCEHAWEVCGKKKDVGTIYNFPSKVLKQDVKIVQHHYSLKRRILFSVKIPLRFSKIMLGLPFEYLELYTYGAFFQFIHFF